jgi:hypothetical protein
VKILSKNHILACAVIKVQLICKNIFWKKKTFCLTALLLHVSSTTVRTRQENKIKTSEDHQVMLEYLLSQLF